MQAFSCLTCAVAWCVNKLGMLGVVVSILYIHLAHDEMDQLFWRTKGGMVMYYDLHVCMYVCMCVYISYCRLYLVVFSVEDSFGALSVTRLEERW